LEITGAEPVGPAPKPEQRIGDVNNDGVINVLDVTLTMQHVINYKLLPEQHKQYGDVNGDGRIDVLDVALIMQKVLGLIDRFPIDL
jgi:hypothetical protein